MDCYIDAWPCRRQRKPPPADIFSPFSIPLAFKREIDNPSSFRYNALTFHFVHLSVLRQLNL